MRAGGALAAVAVAATLGAVVAVSPISPVSAAPGDPVYREQQNSTWQVSDGIVYAMARVGSNLVIGGSFTSLRSPTGTVVARSRLAMINPVTGAPTSWNPGANNTVRALASDGNRVWAGGLFTTIGGVNRNRLASLVASTGAADGNFKANASGEVRALLLHSGKLYAGGFFTWMNGQQRLRAAALSPATGALDATWRPAVNDVVRALAPVPGTGTIALGGHFSAVSGQTRRYLASVHETSGAVTGWAPAPDCDNPSNPCWVLALTATSTLVYGAVAGPGGRVSAWDAGTGARRWSQYGDGDVQALALTGGTIYGGGHFDPMFGRIGSTNQTRRQIAAMDAATGALLPFDPAVTGSSGIWAMLGEDDGLRIAGDFRTVNGNTSIRRFAVFPAAPPPVQLVAAGATWSYQDSGSDLGTAWREPDFDATGWATGPAQLGYGDGDEATTVAPNRLTYYFRGTFTAPAGFTPTSLQLETVRDDGIVVYLNGVEVWRNNMPTGTITATTPATLAISGTAESAWLSVTIPASALRSGTNVIAVEVHNNAPSSSDASFNLRLTGSTA
ncbi:MAG TPA: hypothetical protein VGR21_07450 [Cryptosporangiaceae bacterium]|nr:hypothetical protein [Cryptosporangiaceae bacterium]